MQEFTKKTINIILSIPKGKVMTYGQIASLAGSPRGARQVVRILHSMSGKYNLPWHRVINVKGELSIQDEELFYSQRRSLESEGIQFIKERQVDLTKYRYDPISELER